MRRKTIVLNITFLHLLVMAVGLSACNVTGSTTESVVTPTNDLLILPTDTVIPATPTLDPTSEPTQHVIGNRISDVDGMEMIYIPAGEFIMGWQGTDSTVDVLPGPFPDNMVQTLYLDEYWMDKTEVTNAQYALCVAAGACQPPKQNNIPPQGVAYFVDAEYGDYPVVNVTWYMARDYCGWAGRRLPTEAEWEKAARGTDGRKYPWGDEKYTEDRANICDINCPASKKGVVANPNVNDGFAGPSPVGSFPAGASPYGLLDMAGNVWEWTSTAAMFYPYDMSDERDAQYDAPYGDKWPERILRGGPWNDGIWYQRSSFRYRAVAIYWNFNMGFRCAYSEHETP